MCYCLTVQTSRLSSCCTSVLLMTWWQHAARYHHDRRSSNCAVILMLQNSPARGTLHDTSLPQTAVLGPPTLSILVPAATRFMPQSSQFKIRTFTAITQADHITVALVYINVLLLGGYSSSPGRRPCPGCKLYIFILILHAMTSVSRTSSTSHPLYKLHSLPPVVSLSKLEQRCHGRDRDWAAFALSIVSQYV